MLSRITWNVSIVLNMLYKIYLLFVIDDKIIKRLFYSEMYL